MNKRLKAKWVKALRSGKYKQANGALKDQLEDGTHAFCCLGVLKEIAPSLEQAPRFQLLTAESSGMSRELQVCLAKYNDRGKSFKWIASNIERRKSL